MVARPVHRGAGFLKHGIGAAVASMKVFHNFVSETGGDDRLVVHEHNMTKCGQAMARLKIGFQFLIPVLKRIRDTMVPSLVERAIEQRGLASSG